MKKFCVFTILFIYQFSWASIETVDAQYRAKTASELCHAYTASEELSKVLTTLEVVGKNIYRGAKTALTLDGFGTSQEIKELITSDEYYESLTKCFGSFSENRLKWDSLTLLLILSDAAGQDLAYVGTYTIAGKLFGLFSNLSKLSKLRYVGTYFSANPQALRWIARIGSAFIAGMTLKAGIDTYSKSQQMIDSNTMKIERQTDIKTRALPNLNADYSLLLKRIDNQIIELRNLTATDADREKMVKLQSLRTKTYQKYIEHKNSLETIAKI